MIYFSLGLLKTLFHIIFVVTKSAVYAVNSLGHSSLSVSAFGDVWKKTCLLWQYGIFVFLEHKISSTSNVCLLDLNTLCQYLMGPMRYGCLWVCGKLPFIQEVPMDCIGNHAQFLHIICWFFVSNLAFLSIFSAFCACGMNWSHSWREMSGSAVPKQWNKWFLKAWMVCSTALTLCLLGRTNCHWQNLLERNHLIIVET